MTQLSKDLLPILELEVSLGNRVARTDEGAWTACPYAVVFEFPLHVREIQSQLALAPTVEFWESRDTHYSVENGYMCQLTRHSISGPLP